MSYGSLPVSVIWSYLFIIAHGKENFQSNRGNDGTNSAPRFFLRSARPYATIRSNMKRGLRHMSTLLERARALSPALRAIKEDLHRHPELSFQEHRTTEVIKKELAKLGLEQVGWVLRPAPWRSCGGAAWPHRGAPGRYRRHCPAGARGQRHLLGDRRGDARLWP